MFTPRDNLVDEDMLDPTTQDVLFQEKTGEIEPLDKGKITEVKKGIVSGARASFEGAVTTAGVLGIESARKQSLENEGALRVRGEERPAPGLANKAMHILGTGIAEIPSIVGSTMIGAGLAAGAGKLLGVAGKTAVKLATGGRKLGLSSNIFARQYGQRTIDLERKGATPEVAQIGALVDVVVSYWLEQFAGPERLMNADIDRQMKRWLLKGAESSVDASAQTKLLSRWMKYPKSYSGGVGLSMFEETFMEEIPQLAEQAMMDIALTGKTDVNAQAFWETGFSTPIATAPMAMLFGFSGAAQHARIEQRAKALSFDPIVDQLNEINPQDLIETEAMTTAIASKVAPLIGEDGVPKLAKLMYNISINLATQSDEARPQKFVEEFEVALAHGEIDTQELNTKVNESEDATIDYLRKTLPEFDKQIKEISQKKDTEDLQIENSATARENVQKSSPTYNVDQSKLAETISTTLTKYAEKNRIDGAFSISAEEVAKMLPFNVFQAVYAHGSVNNVEINGEVYNVVMNDTGFISLTPQESTDIEELDMDDYAFESAKKRILQVHSGRLEQAKSIYESAEAKTVANIQMSIENSIRTQQEQEASDLEVLLISNAIKEGAQVPTDRKRQVIINALISNNPDLTEDDLRILNEDINAIGDDKIIVKNEDGIENETFSALDKLLVEGKIDKIQEVAQEQLDTRKAEAKHKADTEDVLEIVARQAQKDLIKSEQASQDLLTKTANDITNENRQKAAAQLKQSKKKAQKAKDKPLVKAKKPGTATLIKSQKNKINQNKKKANNRIKVLRTQKRRRIKRGLKSNNEGTIFGMYLPSTHIAIFYDNATSEDVLHEWFHHMVVQELLPVSIGDVLVKTYGNNGTWDNEAHERAVNAFFAFVEEGILPESAESNPDLVAAFDYITGVMRATTESNDDLLNDQTRDAFSKFFGHATPDSDQEAMADALSNSTDMAQGVNNSTVLSSTGEATPIIKPLLNQEKVQKIKRMRTEKKRKEAMRHELYVSKRYKPTDLDKFAKDNKMDSRSDLTEDMLEDLLVSAGMSSRDALAIRVYGDRAPTRGDRIALQRELNIFNKMDQMEGLTPEKKSDLFKRNESIVNDASEIANDLNIRPNDIQSKNIALGGHNVIARARNTANSIAREADKFKNGILKGMLMKVTGFEALMSIIADGDQNSKLNKVIGKKWNNMQRALAKEVEVQRKWMAAADIKYGRVPQNLGKIAVLDGRNFTASEAIAISMITRGKLALDKDGEFIRHETQALYESNPEIAEGDIKKFMRVAKAAEAYVNADESLRKVRSRLDDYYKWVYPRLNKIKKRLTGKTIGRIKGYFPMIREGGLFIDEDFLAQIMEVTPNKIRSRIGTDGSQQSRKSDAFGARINLDVMNVFESYRNQSQTYIAKIETIDYLQRILNNDTLVKTFAKKGLKKELQTLRTLVERERYATGRMEAWTEGELAVRYVSSRFKLSALAGNMPSIMRQAISGFNGASELPFIDGLRIGYNMTALTAYATTHKSKSGEILAGHETWEMMKDGHSVHTQSQHDASETDAINANGRFINKRIGGLPVKEALVLPQRVVDQITRTSVWGASYEFKRKMLSRTNKTEAEQHTEAFKFADETVSLTQPSANISERNLMQTGSEYTRAMIPFTGQLMKNFDYFRTKMALPLKQAFKKGGVSEMIKVSFTLDAKKLNEYGLNTNIAHKATMSFVMPAIALSLLARGRPPKDWKEFSSDLVAYNLMIVPVIGPAIATLILRDSFSSDAAPLYFDLINSIASAASDTFKAVSEKDKKAAKDISTDLINATKFLGMPNKIIQSYKDWDNGYYEEHGFDIDSVIGHGMFRFTEDDEPGILETLEGIGGF